MDGEADAGQGLGLDSIRGLSSSSSEENPNTSFRYEHSVTV